MPRLTSEERSSRKPARLPSPLTPTPLPAGERGFLFSPLPAGERGFLFSPLPAGERGRGEGTIPASTAACSAGLDQGCSPGLLRTTSQKAAARTTPGAAITSRDALQGSANTPIRS